MSTLSAAVIARYSLAKILNLTNPDAPGATTNDTTRLDAACADTQADFELHADVVFVATDARHIRIGVARVYAMLLERNGQSEGAKHLEASDALLKQLRITGSRGRILPQTNNPATPTTETSTDGRPVRPDFDRARFRDFIPGSPPAIDPWNR